MTTKSKQNLGKKEIVDKLNLTLGFSSKRLEALIDDIIDALIKTLCNEKKRLILKILVHLMLHTKKREKVEIQKQKEHVILSRNTIKFKASNQLKKK